MEFLKSLAESRGSHSDFFRDRFILPPLCNEVARDLQLQLLHPALGSLIKVLGRESLELSQTYRTFGSHDAKPKLRFPRQLMPILNS